MINKLINRKKTILSISLALGLSLLAGCATLYQPPKLGQPTSTVHAVNERNGIFSWINVKVESIDNQSAGFQMLTTSKLRLHPGPHMLTVIAEFNRGAFSGGPFTAITDVKADFKPYQDYVIKASVEGSRFLAWVVDSEGNKISAVSSVGYLRSPSTVYIPVRQ